MLDEWLVILCFVALATAALFALRSVAESLRTAAVTLLIACLLTPVVWMTCDSHLAGVITQAFPADRTEPFADAGLLYLPMSFFVSIVIAAALTAGIGRILRPADAVKTRSALREP